MLLFSMLCICNNLYYYFFIDKLTKCETTPGDLCKQKQGWSRLYDVGNRIADSILEKFMTYDDQPGSIFYCQLNRDLGSTLKIDNIDLLQSASSCNIRRLGPGKGEMNGKGKRQLRVDPIKKDYFIILKVSTN